MIRSAQMFTIRLSALLIAILGGWPTTILPAAEQALKFDHVADLGAIGSPAGLQDQTGFLWFGTQGAGLFRYDGYELRRYAPTPNGLSSGDITRMIADPQQPHVLWIGTKVGLNRFDTTTEAVTVFTHDPANPASLSNDSIYDIIPDGQTPELLWIGTEGGLNQFNTRTGRARSYQHDPADPASLSHNSVWRIVTDRADPNLLWLGTLGGGLDGFHKQRGAFIHYTYASHDLGNANNQISALTADANEPETLWIGHVGGLDRFHPNTGRVVHYRHYPLNAETIPAGNITLIHDAGDGMLWLAGWSNDVGLSVFDKRSQKCRHYAATPDNPRSLSTNLVSHLFRDRAGIYWITAQSGKIDKYDPYTQNFDLYQRRPYSPNSLSDNTVTTIGADLAGRIWLGTQAGLNRFDRHTQTFTRYFFRPSALQTLIENRHITSVHADPAGGLWVSAWPGPLYKIDPDSGEILNRYEPPHADAFLKIMADPDDADILWLGTRLNGLAKFQKSPAKFTFYPPKLAHPERGVKSSVIAAIWHDRMQPVIWSGSWEGGGLNRFDKRTETFTHYLAAPQQPNCLSVNAIASIYQDAAGALWLGTLGGGLAKMDTQRGNFTHYGPDYGIPANVNAILEDSDGRLWLSTDQGIVCFNPATEAVAERYHHEDGLQGDNFLHGSGYQAPDGAMWFGGTNGVNAFWPAKIQRNAHIPPVVLTKLSQGDEPVVLPASPTVTHLRAVTLRWPQNFFEFTYAALNFTNPSQNHYRYILEGWDPAWYDAGVTRTGRYSGLRGGKYTLRVQGSNNNGVWNETGVSLHITVIPPFWQAIWFRLLAFVVGVGLIGGIAALRVLTVHAQKQRLTEQVAERTRALQRSNEQLELSMTQAEVANRAKSTFLANMSHEFRTPLNAILGFTQLMARERDFPSAYREYLGIVMRSGEHLLTLINQILNMSKIEAGRMNLHPTNFDLYRLLDDVVEMFTVWADEKRVRLLFERWPDVPQYICTDEVKLRQVIINLLNNALKFTHEGGVSIRVKRAAENNPPEPALTSAQSVLERQKPSLIILFEIEDSGQGIAAAELAQIFEPFAQSETSPQMSEGAGLGLPISRSFVRLMGGELGVQSQLGKGTLFTFQIQAQIVHASEIFAPQPRRRVIGLEPEQPRYRLLIVDDKWDNRRLLVRLLEPIGFEVREAANGQEAIDIWKTWEPHLIWMDMRMPVMDGYQATEQIKATTKGQATAIIALTASAFEEEKVVALSAGCDDFLRKPFREAEIFDIAHKHLGVRYLYEDVIPCETPKAPPLRKTDLTLETLNQLSQASLTYLEHTLVIGDFVQISEAITEIRQEHPALADALATFTDDFEYGEILAMLELLKK